MNPRFDLSEIVTPNCHPKFSSSPGQWNDCAVATLYVQMKDEGALIDHLKIRTWRMVWESVNQELSFTRGKYKYTCHSQ